MLKLYSFAGSKDLRSFSPFAYKAEALLALSGVAYEREDVGDFATMPKGKVPVLQADDHQIADSELIKQYLCEHHGLAADDTLTAEQQAIAHALRVMLEERTYWALVYSRFCDPEGKGFVFETMLAGAPTEAKATIYEQLQEKIRKQTFEHGIGRHDTAQIYAFAIADIQAVLTFLGDKAFLFGDTPTTTDATCVAIFANLLANRFDCPLSQFVQNEPKIAQYVKRFEQKVFGE
ncbi:hypothetical protein B0181_00595 [Moraxella caviae]|uniref:GST N-terminal domain-containing protein n=1 Tax=Moraxella caviae TaxID=34060 RepID=A0A1T0ABT2_9GAMM|nr:glutathione S-transferase family protein [Moraxella caviae]OOR93176.1 hypothetical protein B0181_00595 [Moraxella caviae]STZ10445.1 Uncharacterised protein [Moraxella caviae]